MWTPLTVDSRRETQAAPSSDENREGKVPTLVVQFSEIDLERLMERERERERESKGGVGRGKR